MISRREFLKYAGIAGAAAALPLKIGVRSAQAFSQTIPLSKFTQPMRIFGTDIPLAATTGTPYAGVDYYEITAGVFTQQLHPTLPPPGTRLFGYTDGIHPHTHLGAPILAFQGKPVRIKFTNNLPATQIVPFDASITQGFNVATSSQSRAAIHLHGGLVPWTSDGGPFHWLESGLNTQSGVIASGVGKFGASVVDWLPNTAGTLTNDYFYPNNQSPRFMWYHDHAIGITRTNAYSGIATGYLVTDAGVNPTPELGLPIPGVVMVFQDKIFWDGPAGKDPTYATYAPGAVAGDLWYPYLYESNRWKLGKSKLAPPIPSCIPEFFGDTMLVNGTVYPFHNVDEGGYRLRLLNACNARFLNLSFVQEDPKTPNEPLMAKGLPVPALVDVWMVGTEGGFLAKPTQIFQNGLPVVQDPITGVLTPFVPTPTNPGPLLVGPAERPDLIVDFSKCVAVAPATTYNVILYNDAQAPFPGGSQLNDYFFTGGKSGAAGQTKAGFGPNTRTAMKFVVSANVGSTITVPTSGGVTLLPTAPDLVNGGLMLTGTPTGTANLTLNETFDTYGRLMQLVGTTVLPNPALPGAFGRAYLDAPTEQVQFGGVYVWNVFNLTADTHPMHVHEFNAMILSRRLFDVKNFTGTPVYLALGVGPSPTENGWKETFKMNPGECTKLAILVEDPLPEPTYPHTGSYTFQIPGNGLGTVTGRPTVPVSIPGALSTDPPVLVGTGVLPISPRLLEAQYGRIVGDEYVWHCHILEHEEHDMMRPLVCHYLGA
jgi:spore coat protein A, manganese oxidase